MTVVKPLTGCKSQDAFCSFTADSNIFLSVCCFKQLNLKKKKIQVQTYECCTRSYLNFCWSQCRGLPNRIFRWEKKPPGSSLIWKTVLNSKALAAASMLTWLSEVFYSYFSAICQPCTKVTFWWLLVMESTWIAKRKHAFLGGWQDGCLRFHSRNLQRRCCIYNKSKIDSSLLLSFNKSSSDTVEMS